MGKDERAKRDGTGPHKDSYRATTEGKNEGRRKEKGEKCLK